LLYKTIYDWLSLTHNKQVISLDEFRTVARRTVARGQLRADSCSRIIWLLNSNGRLRQGSRETLTYILLPPVSGGPRKNREGGSTLVKKWWAEPNPVTNCNGALSCPEMLSYLISRGSQKFPRGNSEVAGGVQPPPTSITALTFISGHWPAKRKTMFWADNNKIWFKTNIQASRIN
jgi:hypothetical protein